MDSHSVQVDFNKPLPQPRNQTQFVPFLAKALTKIKNDWCSGAGLPGCQAPSLSPST